MEPGGELQLASNNRTPLEEAAAELRRQFGSALSWRGVVQCKDCALHFVRFRVGMTGSQCYVGLAQAVPYEAIQDTVKVQGKSILWLVLTLTGVTAFLAAGLASGFWFRWRWRGGQ